MDQQLANQHESWSNYRCNNITVDSTVTANAVVAGSATITSLFSTITNLSGSVASQSLSQGHSSQIVTQPQPTVNITLTIPAAASSSGSLLKIFFPTAGDATHTWTLQTTSSENTLVGSLVNGPTTGLLAVAVSAHHTVARSASGVAGDYLELACDGANWYVKAFSTGSSIWSSSA